jgi:WS/DGAT/MGAT family acyltransferase
MAGADALLWTIDRDPILRSTIVAVLVLDHAPPQDEVVKLFEGLRVALPRLAWRGTRPAFGFGRARWVPDPEFDLGQHLRRVAAPEPGTLQTVLELAESMAGTGFDPALAPWEALTVENMAGGLGALVVKVHHAVVDGIGGLQALLSAADTALPGPPPSPQSPSPSPTEHQRATGLAALGGLAGNLLGAPVRVAADTWHALGTAGRLLAPAPTPCSPILRRRGILRRFAVLDVDNARLRAAGHATGGTLNDAFVAAVLGGLCRYHERHGQPARWLRGLLPVSIRSGDDAIAGNRFVPMRFVFPCDDGPAAQRIARVHTVTAAPVHDAALRVSDTLAAGLARLPAPASTAAFGSMLKGSDFVATNVPGPKRPVQVAGAEVTRIYAFSPPSGAALNVSLVSVGDRAFVGINIDRAAVPDDRLLVDCLTDGFAEVAEVATHRGARP